MINHSNEKPFKCHICHISYSQKSRLEIHLRKHFGIKPFKCDICGNHFTEKGNLNVHMKSHRGKRDYECEVCGQKFITKGHLEDHFRRHKKDRKFKCDTCGSEFYRSNQLKNHQQNQMRCMKNKQLKEYEDNYFSAHRKTLGPFSHLLTSSIRGDYNQFGYQEDLSCENSVSGSFSEDSIIGMDDY